MAGHGMACTSRQQAGGPSYRQAEGDQSQPQLPLSPPGPPSSSDMMSESLLASGSPAPPAAAAAALPRLLRCLFSRRLPPPPPAAVPSSSPLLPPSSSSSSSSSHSSSLSSSIESSLLPAFLPRLLLPAPAAVFEERRLRGSVLCLRCLAPAAAAAGMPPDAAPRQKLLGSLRASRSCTQVMCRDWLRQRLQHSMRGLAQAAAAPVNAKWPFPSLHPHPTSCTPTPTHLLRQLIPGHEHRAGPVAHQGPALGRGLCQHLLQGPASDTGAPGTPAATSALLIATAAGAAGAACGGQGGGVLAVSTGWMVWWRCQQGGGVVAVSAGWVAR